MKCREAVSQEYAETHLLNEHGHSRTCSNRGGAVDNDAVAPSGLFLLIILDISI